MANVAKEIQAARLKFTLADPSRPSFSPRLGTLVLSRASSEVQLQTPTYITTTSRGAVPHLSRDHVQKTPAIKWLNVAFESFLEHNPPVPTLVSDDLPLHNFLGFGADKYIVSMSLRDWNDVRDIPPNGKDSVSARCVRGVKTVTPGAYNAYVSAIKPDITFALSDTLIANTTPSERRMTKSLERSLRWLGALLRTAPPNVFVPMAGGLDDVARDDFATGLLEELQDSDARELGPMGFSMLDDGVTGYSIDVAPLRLQMPDASPITHLVNLTQISLKPLPTSKPRLVTGSTSPHEMLKFIQTGFDLFDSHLAQSAADWGVALDFVFPVNDASDVTVVDIGHNLYDSKYEMDFGSLSDNLSSRNTSTLDATKAICDCIACSPIFSSDPLVHATIDGDHQTTKTPTEFAPPVTRAYIHHLLHTHEMSAHALLASHNYTVLSTFFQTTRQLLSQQPDSFDAAVARFEEKYKAPEELLGAARAAWEDVNFARGKGRLAREKAAKIGAVDDVSGAVLQGGAVSGVIEETAGAVDPASGEVIADAVLGC